MFKRSNQTLGCVTSFNRHFEMVSKSEGAFDGLRFKHLTSDSNNNNSIQFSFLSSNSTNNTLNRKNEILRYKISISDDLATANDLQSSRFV